jgi:hypothetical protein
MAMEVIFDFIDGGVITDFPTVLIQNCPMIWETYDSSPRSRADDMRRSKYRWGQVRMTLLMQPRSASRLQYRWDERKREIAGEEAILIGY